VFLKEAVDRGLDSAIVNCAKIYPVFRIPQIEDDLARKLVFRDESAGDPLQVYMAHFDVLQGGGAQLEEQEPVESLSIEDKLKAADHQRRADYREGRGGAASWSCDRHGAEDVHAAWFD
jgi:cobalamin-dependent methionine synthase I